MIRHLEESDKTEVDRDGEINAKEVDLLINSYIPAILEEIESGKYDSVTVISSDKLRSKQTTEILKDELLKHVSVPINQETDPRTSAEVHGVYRNGVEQDNPLIKKAKLIYLREAFEKGNVWYRHGSVENDFDEETYPELDQIFVSSGENQIELNIRMYRFILDLLNRIKENPKNLFVLSTHHIVMSTILSLQYIAEKVEPPISLSNHPQGELYRRENKATEEMIGGWDKFYDFYKTRNYVFDIEVSKLEQIKNVMQSELDMFLAKYEQHYGKAI